MRAFIILAILAVASAKPQIIYNSWPFGSSIQYAAAPSVTYAANGITYSAAPAITYAAAAPAIVAPIATKTQYHAQDELGQASFGYSYPGQAAAAVRDAFGGVRGSYAYIGADGKEVIVNYQADSANGYRVQSNALPIGPAVPEAPVLVPVQDTPEVAEAKAAHAKATLDAIARNAEADKKDAVEEKEKAPEKAEEKKSEAVITEAAAAPSRRKRSPKGLGLTTYAAAPVVHSTVIAAPHTVTYAAAPALTYAAAPALTYAAAPALTYAAAPALTYAAAPALAYSGLTYAAPAVRSATLTKVVNTPGHAVSYRVD